MSSVDRLQDLIRSRVRPELLDGVPVPLLGTWSTDSADLVSDLLATLAIKLWRDGHEKPWPMLHKALAIRSTPLACFPKARFHDVVVEDRSGAIGQVGILSQASQVLSLGTRADEVYTAVETLEFDLTTPEAAADYFRLFCWSICSEAGPFQIIETRDQLPPALRDHVRAASLSPIEPGLSGSASRAKTPEELADLTEEELEDIKPKLWRIKPTIIHDGQLFDADLLLMPGARVKMVKDHPVKDAVDKSRTWRLERFLRFLEMAR